MGRPAKKRTRTRRNPSGSGWRAKGFRAGVSGKYGSMYDGWNAASGKPPVYTSSGAVSGEGVEAKEYFFEGFLRGQEALEKKKNPKSLLPRGKWINAKIRVTKSGKIQARIKR